MWNAITNCLWFLMASFLINTGIYTGRDRKMKITPINEELVEEGKWVEYCGVPLKVGRTNSKRFKKAFRRLSKPYERKMRENKLDPETSEKLYCRAMAEAVLLDWDENQFPGKVAYSHDAAEQLLLDDVDCRDFVAEVAGDAENYFAEEEEDKMGKSSRPSSGKSNLAA
jgi:hypothetical protein